MTATVPDAKSLYAVCPDFKAFIAIWAAERRCPLPVVDLLLEAGLTAQAEACRWAAGEEQLRWDGSGYERCGPFPLPDYFKQWYWLVWDTRRYTNTNGHRDTQSHILDWMQVRSDYPLHDRPDTPAPALLWLLDHWIHPV